MKVWLIRFRGVETPIESVLFEQINRMLRALRAVSAVQRTGRAVLLASSAESLGVLWMHGKFAETKTSSNSFLQLMRLSR